MKKLLLSLFLIVFFIHVSAQQLISFKNEAGNFLISATNATSIYVDINDAALVLKAAELFSSDIEKVSGKKPAIIHQLSSQKNIIIIGSLNNSSLIKKLVASKKINPTAINGKWEAYHIQVISKPFPGIDNALVITGNDRRGVAFGVFDLSQQMGVSPWNWWADVPVKKQDAIYFKKNATKTDAPLVKYRGIFINDEAPALSNWSRATFGGFNHKFYEKVFELMLRLKSNYLWPAMWGNAFYDDDSLNIKMADEYGIVIGTSHHEPLMRAHDEWRRYGKNQKWNYDSTETGLKEFWRGGMQRATNEKIVSVGMRGDGDEPMSRQTATALLERIVKDQRSIIEEVTGKPASQTPQLWALYKEVQDYYDKGMRVPDDITLLLCDDNWGNIRKLPKLDEKPRKGGYGIYYHFDYVGGPRNYKWINTNQISRVWEQMHMAWEYNARQIWIVNVGDIKPMEFPISFFLDYAWNPTKIDASDLKAYTERWSAQQFGTQYSKEIATIISTYTKYNSRRKPELLDANTYSIDNYQEAQRITDEYNNLKQQAEEIQKALTAEYQDAYYQLVLHPVSASANLQQLYTNVAFNRRQASRKNIFANRLADYARQAYINDSLITLKYHQLGGGKWNHMMSQTHIGYTYWQQPPVQKMPEIVYVSPDSAIESATLISGKSKTSESLIPSNKKGNVFYEKDDYISIAADHFSTSINNKGIYWKILPDLGRTGSAVTSFPVTAAPQKPGANAPHLQFEVYTYNKGQFKVNAYFSPTLNFHNAEEGLQYAISVDDEAPQIISINKEDKNSITGIWNKWVGENIIIKTTNHNIAQPGKHTIKYWMVNSGVVLQKMVVDFGGVRPSYLGPPETRKN